MFSIDQGYSILALLFNNILGWIILCCEFVLCLVGYLASLAPLTKASGTSFPRYDNQNFLQTLPMMGKITPSFFFLSPSQRVCPYLAHGGQGQAILQFEAKTWNSPWDPNTSHCLGQMTPSPFVLVTAWPFPSWASSLSLENWERVMQRGERQGRFLQVHLEGPLCFF